MSTNNAIEVGAPSLEQWAKVELFGHQVLFARVSKADIGDFLKLDIPNENGEIDQTRLINPKAVYAVTFISKELCLTMAASRDQTPVKEWEFPGHVAAALPAPPDDDFPL